MYKEITNNGTYSNGTHSEWVKTLAPPTRLASAFFCGRQVTYCTKYFNMYLSCSGVSASPAPDLGVQDD